MAQKPLFEGLVYDEFDNLVEVNYVGDEPFYVVDDAGFHRHIPSEQAVRKVAPNHQSATDTSLRSSLHASGPSV